MLMHNVYFWLKPDADKDLMEKGLRLLGTVPVVQSYHWGAHAESKKRDVLRDDYDYAINVKLANQADNEVYAVFDVGVDAYPEGDGMSELAFDSCLKRFEPFVGKDYQSSALDIFPMYPTMESWKQRDDREVICAVYDMTLAKLEGSVAGTGL